MDKKYASNNFTVNNLHSFDKISIIASMVTRISDVYRDKCIPKAFGYTITYYRQLKYGFGAPLTSEAQGIVCGESPQYFEANFII